jgi:hypothetical protein
MAHVSIHASLHPLPGGVAGRAWERFGVARSSFANDR